MADEPHSIADLLRVLVDHGVDFVVCGGVACIMHGVNRTTADIDIAVRLSDDNLRNLIAAPSAAAGHVSGVSNQV